MKLIFAILFLASFFTIIQSNVPDLLTKSMKVGIKKLGINCMKSVGATMEEMNSIRHGPPYKGKASCAIGCIMEKAGIMSEKKFSRKGFLKAVTPFLLGDAKKLSHMKSIANDCEKEEGNSTNECDSAEHVIQCLHKNIPQLAEIEF